MPVGRGSRAGRRPHPPGGRDRGPADAHVTATAAQIRGYAPDGLPEASTLLDYLLPTAADMPPVELLETETPNPNVPLGSKGAGEAGCIGVPPAVVSAVCDALDIDHIDMPLTPETVWRAAHPAR